MPLLLKHFQLERSSDFVAMTHQRFQKAEIASAAALVLENVETDPLAHDIGCRAVDELCLLVDSVMAQLPLERPRVALSGGVIENNVWIQTRLLAALAEKHPELETVLGSGDALKGACMLARE